MEPYNERAGLDTPTMDRESSDYRNGHDDDERAPTRMRGPRMPGANERWLTLPAPYGDTDPPMKVRIWVNYPNHLADDLASGDDDLIYAAWAQIILEHNNWLDEDGRPLPALKRGDDGAMRAFWRAIPNECAQAIATLVGQAAGKASASITNRAQRRGR
jgi:hypothetical protein